MNVKVVYFAALKDVIGIDSELISLSNEADTDGLMKLLSKKYPSANKYFENSKIAVNYEYCANKALKDNDEVAFILPVSGG